MAMTRKECENKLLEKCKEMSDILKEYDPQADYLSVVMYPSEDYWSINNNHWEGHPMISCNSYEVLSDV